MRETMSVIAADINLSLKGAFEFCGPARINSVSLERVCGRFHSSDFIDEFFGI